MSTATTATTGANAIASSGFVRLERHGNIGAIVLDRPQSRNALNYNMYAEMAAAFRAYQADESVNVILIRGEGRDFCAGNDISDFRRFGDVVEKTGLDPQSVVSRNTPSMDLVYVLIETDKPIVACIQGNAVGFGATMLLHFDAIVAEPDTKIKFPFVDLAMVPEAGSSLLLKERVGYLNAARILFHGNRIEAPEALALGLVSEVVGAGEAAARGMAIATAFAAKPPIALQATKRLLKRDNEPLADRVTEEFRRIAERSTSAEALAIFATLLKK